LLHFRAKHAISRLAALFVRRTVSLMFRSALVAISILSFGLSTTACGGSPPARTAKIRGGEMPEGESWNGVYFHPLYGYLHVAEDGTNLVGRWRRADGSAWGELSGTRDGNLFRYEWQEHKIGLVGPAATSAGKGYFLYKVGKEKGVPELDGQFGLNADETGSDWHCLKQQRMQPDLKSINGDTGGMSPPAANTWQ
jgi:hypothetical protein